MTAQRPHLPRRQAKRPAPQNFVPDTDYLMVVSETVEILRLGDEGPINEPAR